MRVFLDTSALIVLYHAEPKTLQVEAYAKGAKIFISRLALTEFRSAVHRIVRGGSLTLHSGRALVEAFRKDLGTYLIQEIDTNVWRESAELVEKYGSTINLRTLDAIQLATAKRINARNSVKDFVTLDVHGLSQAAEAEGFTLRP
jgi:predicted nucleic acid-binding protein